MTYNGEKWIEKCLISLKNSEYQLQILVVDNLSTDSTISIIKKFEDVKIIKNNENLGFGQANNIGIKFALKNNADYVFLLNQDTWVFEKTISNLITVADKHPEFGILSPIHLSPDSINLDEKFKVYYNRGFESIEKNIVLVPFVNAAAWLISKSCLVKVGFFEPLFAHYGEDNEFCRRALYHNFKIGIVKNAKICHDRTIKRSYKKDLTQSKLQILFDILNFNNGILKSYFIGFKSIFGSIKYYSKFYSIPKMIKLFFALIFEYFTLMFMIKKIIKSRKSKII